MENQEALETCALVSQLANPVQDKVNDLLANGVVATGIVIGSILLACDELLRVEELAVGASANFIDDRGFQVYKHCPGHMLASSCLTEEGVEGVISSPNGLVTWHLAIRLDAMFQAVELPAGIADLDTSLANVDGDALTLWKEGRTCENVTHETLGHGSKIGSLFRGHSCLGLYFKTKNFY